MIVLVRKNLRSHTSTTRNIKNTKSTKRSTKSIIHRSQRNVKVQRREKGLKRGSLVKTEVKEDNIIIAVREINNHPEVVICSHHPHRMIEERDINLEISRAMAGQAFHQIEVREAMSLEVDFHRLSLHLTNMVEPNMKKARIAVSITITEAVVVVQVKVADLAVPILSSLSSSRMNLQRK